MVGIARPLFGNHTIEEILHKRDEFNQSVAVPVKQVRVCVATVQ